MTERREKKENIVTCYTCPGACVLLQEGGTHTKRDVWVNEVYNLRSKLPLDEGKKVEEYEKEMKEYMDIYSKTNGEPHMVTFLKVDECLGKIYSRCKKSKVNSENLKKIIESTEKKLTEARLLVAQLESELGKAKDLVIETNTYSVEFDKKVKFIFCYLSLSFFSSFSNAY